MNNGHTKMTCAEFQAKLPELIGSGANVADHEHLQTCELCRALLADLETIAEAARQLFPVEKEPPDKLWDQIELAIKSETGRNGSSADKEHASREHSSGQDEDGDEDLQPNLTKQRK
jgi:hypothetical protein